jgi:type IV secretion system protein VirB4
MRLPAASRSIGALREMLGHADAEGIGARLERWCLGGPMGWAFDGQVDEVSMAARFVGFDMTDFLENPEIRTPMMLYLFHRVDDLLDGQRVVVDIDEFWKALQDEAFSAFAQDGLKTFRKRNAFMVFGTQSPADALRSPSPIRSSSKPRPRSSCPTRTPSAPIIARVWASPKRNIA